MKIELHEIPIKDIFNGFVDNDEEGVRAYGGKLDIRPKYQRNFIYHTEQEIAVIETILAGFPLNVMYWAVNKDGTYEILDGQQRTMSFCKFMTGAFSFTRSDKMEIFYHSLTADEKKLIDDYKIMVYFCEGSDSEKLAWFKTINISGETLSDQELRNAVYTGPWLTDAKKYFSKRNGAAINIGEKYITGDPNRQSYLERALIWKSHNDPTGYMASHQTDPNAAELWLYFRNVIEWVQTTFPNYRKAMKEVDWGYLYDTYGTQLLDSAKLEVQINALLADDDVTKQSGIWSYVLTNDEKCLSIRNFTNNMKQTAYAKQNGICKICGKHFDIDEMEGDHIIPWSKGGKTTSDNCQMLCKHCNSIKSNN